MKMHSNWHPFQVQTSKRHSTAIRMTAATSVNWNRSNLMAAMSLISLSLISETMHLQWNWIGLQGLNQFVFGLHAFFYPILSVLFLKIMWQMWVYLTLFWTANISYFCVSSKGTSRFPHSLQFSRVKRNIKAEPGRRGLMFSFLALSWADIKKGRC